MKEVKNVPQLRFKGFDGEWEVTEFGSILEEDLERSVLENEDILLSSAIEGMFLNSELFSHQRGESNIGYRKLKKNMLVLSAQNLHLGNANVNLRFEHGLVSPAYKIYKIIKCEPKFLSAWIKKEETKHFFLMATTEGASGCRKNVVWDDLYKQHIFLPSFSSEQQKIGTFLSHVDGLIQAKTKKLESLKAVKKSLLQKCFPKAGQKVPEIRFAGFSGEWEEKKLGEICEINPSSNIPKIFEYVDLESVLGSEMISHRTELKNSAPSRAQRVAKKGDVFYQTVRPYQKNNFLFELDSSNYVFSTGYAQLRPKEVNSQFLMCQIQSDTFVTKILEKCTGTSYPAINATELSEITVLVTKSDAEQEKIGRFFSKYDSLISSQQKEIDKLKDIKKALLQKMFV